MFKITDFFASLTGRPKNFEAAAATLTEAKTFADSVTALFSAAGLNLEQLLAAGPESLKAHIDSLDDSEAFAEALLENENLSAQVASLRASIEEHEAERAACNEVFAAIGLAGIAAKTPAAQIKTAFDQHVSLAVTRELAKTGVPPVANPPAEPAAKSDAELAAEYAALPFGRERLAFYTKHEAALRRAAAR